MTTNDSKDFSQSFPNSGVDEFPPPSSTVTVEFGADSRRGAARQMNEDHYLVIRMGRHQETLMSSLSDEAIMRRFDEHGYAMVVADGMGSSGKGEVASRLAIATLVHLVRHFGKWNLRIDDRIAREIMDRADRFYRHVDGTVAHQGLTNPSGAMQTTLTAAFGAGRDLFFAHVGHSRAYVFREGRLLRLTRDHTIGPRNSKRLPVAPLVDVSATARDLQHLLTDTIGMTGPVGPQIDIERVRVQDRDIVLVCTNGLTDVVDEEIIGEMLTSSQSLGEQSTALVERAVAAGGVDDTTVVLARLHIPPEPV